jgi:hypothetical protein
LKKLKVLAIFLILFTIVSVSLGPIALSQTVNNTNAAQGLQISPTRIEINQINPGESRSTTITVINITSSDLTYGSRVADFSASDESGSPKINDDEEIDSSISVKTWITGLPDNFILKARETKEIPIQINVPINAEIGGHYGVVLFPGTETEVDRTGVGLSASTGVLILISVGDASQINEEAEIEEFYSAANSKQSSFFENSPIDFVVRIKNIGNVHVKPVGSIEISDMFGNVVGSLSVNEQSSNVLPNSVRRFESSFDKSWVFGKYTANLVLGYGTRGQAITGTIKFWVIPYKLILVLILVLGTLIYIFKRLIKTYNRRIIEKSRHEESNKTNIKKD